MNNAERFAQRAAEIFNDLLAEGADLDEFQRSPSAFENQRFSEESELVLAEVVRLAREMDEAALGEPSNDDVAIRREFEPLVASVSLKSPKRIGAYSVEGLIEEGGQGRVYLGRGPNGRRVAIKVLRLAGGSSAARFHNEAELGKLLEHRGLAELLHVGRDREHGSFLVYEFIDGLPLPEKIEVEAARSYLMQLAEATDYLHSRRVIHRDLKPDNILLTQRSGEGAGTLKVIDLGIAARVEETSVERRLTVPGSIVGSLSYMSPEQIRSEPADLRMDIWAFGLVAFRLLVGGHPFPEGEDSRDRLRILEEGLDRSLLDGVDEDLRDLVCRCLEFHKENRPQSFTEIKSALNRREALPAPVAKPAAPTRTSWWSIGRASSLALLLVVLAVVFSISRPEDEGAPVSPPPVSRPVLAVASFSVAGDLAGRTWAGSVTADMVAFALGDDLGLRVLHPEHLVPFDREFARPRSHETILAKMKSLEGAIGVRYLVSGSLGWVGDRGSLVTIDCFVTDLDSQREETKKFSTSGSFRALAPLALELGARIRAELGLPPLSAEDRSAAEANLQKAPDAVEMYGRGFQAALDGRTQDAIDLLSSAVVLEPTHPIPHIRLAEAREQQGDRRGAQENWSAAADLAQGLSRSEQSVLSVFSGVLKEKNDESARTLWLPGVPQDDAERGLELAKKLRGLGETSASLVVLERLEAAMTVEDPRIALAQAEILRQSGDDPAAALTLARRSLEVAQSGGFRDLLARSLLVEASALHDLGEEEAGRKSLALARDAYASIGDAWGSTSVIALEAEFALGRGDGAGAIRLYSVAAAEYEEQGSRLDAAFADYNRSSTLVNLGQLSLATEGFESVLATLRELGAAERIGGALLGIGTVLHYQGDLDGAFALYEQVLEDGAASKKARSAALTNSGEIQYVRGDLASSKRLHSDALAINRELGDRPGQAYDLWRLGLVQYEMANPTVARSRLRAAIDLQEVDLWGKAVSWVSLAEVELLDAELEASLAAAKKADDVGRGQGDNDLRTTALGVSARTLWLLGREEEARDAYGQLRRLAATTEDPLVRWTSAIARAKFALLSEEPNEREDLVALLQGVVREASASGHLIVEIEAALLLSRLRAFGAQNGVNRAGLADRAASLGLLRLVEDSKPHL